MICLALLLPAPVSARFGNSDLRSLVIGSQGIVDVTIIEAKAQTWLRDGKQEVCGIIYTARVNETLKGTFGTTVTFGESAEFAPSERGLFFLNAYVGGFATDVLHKRRTPEENDCIARLPLLKSNWLSTARFLSDELVALSYWTNVPAELHPKMIRADTALVDGRSTHSNESKEAGAFLTAEKTLGSPVVRWDELRLWTRSALDEK